VGGGVRRAAKIDANQPAIVAALERVGAKCYFLGKPLDLLVGYRGKNLILEVKNPDGKDEITREQAEFMATWPGEYHIVRSVKEALTAVLGKECMQ